MDLPKEQLQEKKRKRFKNEKNCVWNEKSAAAVLPTQKRESPDVSKTNRPAEKSKKILKFGVPSWPQGFLFGSSISVRPTPKPDESISASVRPSETQKMLVYFVHTRQTRNFRPTRNLPPPIKPRPPKTARPPKIARQKGR